MIRKIGLFLLISVFLAGIFVALSKQDRSEAREPMSDSSDLLDEDPYLGDGAYAEWAADGSEAIGPDGGASLATLIVHGRETEDIVVRLTLVANIGALRTTILDDEVAVGQNAETAISLDVRPAFSLHSKQQMYPTKISGTVQVVSSPHRYFKGQTVPYRYFALKGEQASIYDAQTFFETYPRGVTDESELARVQKLIESNEDRGEFAQGGIIPAGVYESEPLEK